VGNQEDSAFSKVIQIGVVVKDIDKTVARLTALGIGPFKTHSLPADREEWYGNKRMYAEFKFRMANIGDMQLELIQPISGDSPHKDFLESRGEGIQHIACSVKDVQKEVNKLTKLGVDIVLRAKFPEGGGVAYCDLGSGLIIELIQQNKSK
jgi:methylmalonyl-CoA/ethylmalonyl-CoA epimerase